MKYKIYDTNTGEYLDDRFILTQDGLFAQWDESQGWDDSLDQDRYLIQVTHDGDLVNADLYTIKLGEL